MSLEVRRKSCLLPILSANSFSYDSRHTRTPLANTGHPANNPTERRTSENTCDVDGSLEARTIEADKALVKDKEEVKLRLAMESEV
jgi:hypothetical protein